MSEVVEDGEGGELKGNRHHGTGFTEGNVADDGVTVMDEWTEKETSILSVSESLQTRAE